MENSHFIKAACWGHCQGFGGLESYGRISYWFLSMLYQVWQGYRVDSQRDAINVVSDLYLEECVRDCYKLRINSLF